MSHSTFYLGEICGLIGRLWLREVDVATLNVMNDPEFLGLYESLGGFVPTDITAGQVEELAVAYCELLVGPKGHVSPVQSVWTKDQLQSETSASMNRFFELVPGYQAQSSLADHVGVQLDFAGVLLQTQEESVSEIMDVFAREHFGWMNQFLGQVELKTDSEFYLGLATVTRSLIGSITE